MIIISCPCTISLLSCGHHSLPRTPSSHVLLMPNSKHLTHDISNLVSLITKTKLWAFTRRWVEGVFSRSKCASISQICKSEPPRAGHLLFITFHSRASRYQLHWTIFGGVRRCTVASVAKPIDATDVSIAPCDATCPHALKANGRNPSVRRSTRRGPENVFSRWAIGRVPY
jgi:hypothetical protein